MPHSTPASYTNNERGQNLPSRTSFIHTLIPVAPSSAAPPCPICHEDYTATHPPVLLPPCGHIFGRPCILEWFNEERNTCPLDRKVLFEIPEEVERWSLVPFRNQATRGGRSGTGASVTRRNAISRARPTDRYMFMGGDIVAVNSRLTLTGCRLFIRDLYHHISNLVARFRNHTDELDVLAFDEALLRETVDDALPMGVEVQVQVEGWSVLVGVVRWMVVLCLETEWEGEGLGEREVEDCVEEVWGWVGGGVGVGDGEGRRRMYGPLREDT